MWDLLVWQTRLMETNLVVVWGPPQWCVTTRSSPPLTLLRIVRLYYCSMEYQSIRQASMLLCYLTLTSKFFQTEQKSKTVSLLLMWVKVLFLVSAAYLCIAACYLTSFEPLNRCILPIDVVWKLKIGRHFKLREDKHGTIDTRLSNVIMLFSKVMVYKFSPLICILKQFSMPHLTGYYGDMAHQPKLQFLFVFPCVGTECRPTKQGWHAG